MINTGNTFNPMEPLISIVVPIYNVESYLTTCVDSIVNQTYKRLEILLVDDGSPDNCGAICDAYASSDRRIRVIHKENGGLVSARKAGLAQSTGDYVLNVDGDDYIGPELLEKMVAIISAHEPDVIAFGGTAFSDRGERPFYNDLPEGIYEGADMQKIRASIIFDDHMKLKIYFAIWDKVVKRELLLPRQNAVPNDVKKGEDLAVTAPLLKDCRSVYISPCVDYFYRNNPNSIMHTFNFAELKQIERLADFVQSQMGAEYRAKINALALVQLSDFALLVLESRAYGCKEFGRVMKENVPESLQARIRMVPIYRKTLKKMVLAFMLKREWYGLAWLVWQAKTALRK